VKYHQGLEQDFSIHVKLFNRIEQSVVTDVVSRSRSQGLPTN
jgi:hypothetical protein